MKNNINTNSKDTKKTYKFGFRIWFPFVGAILINPLTVILVVEYFPQLFK